MTNTNTHHPVPVATEPSENAMTYAQVIADATRHTEPFIDHETPEGHFGVFVENIGGYQTYWFRGDLADPDARIVARSQVIVDQVTHYVGGSLLGGTLSPRRRD